MEYQGFSADPSGPAEYWPDEARIDKVFPAPQVSLPEAPRTRYKKRIIICCDGTWQDGFVVSQRWKYTNVLRLARAIHHSDERFDPPIPQVVFYQSGVGTENFKVITDLEGAVGATLGDKVQEAYGFLAHNYQPGDEIHIFGFSRGAYTARMVAAFIGAIGVLNKKDMDHFAEIFVNFQKRGKAKDEKERDELDEKLRPWTSHDSAGKWRADADGDSFSIQCVGVFDTVGAIGLPQELTRHSDKINTLFGFPDKLLGEHIARAYQALALNECRKDFDCAKFEQTEGGRRKNQILKQCWFAGSHCDIGGGFQEHDLSDLTLAWMASNICDILSLDTNYLKSIIDPVAPWGEQLPHNSLTGIYSIAETIHRQLPSHSNDVTHETVHASVKRQDHIDPKLAEYLNNNPSLVLPLHPFEEEIRSTWKVSPERAEAYQHSKSVLQSSKVQDVAYAGSLGDHKDNEIIEVAEHVFKAGKLFGHNALQSLTHTKTVTKVDGKTAVEESWVGKILEESSMGPFIRELASRR